MLPITAHYTSAKFNQKKLENKIIFQAKVYRTLFCMSVYEERIVCVLP